MNFKQIIFTISQVKGAGNKSLIAIAELLEQSNQLPSTAKDIHSYFEEAKVGNARLKLPELADIDDALKKAEEILIKSESNGIKIITYRDKEYPHLLNQIPDKPLLLHCKGNIAALSSKCVAIIGTREPSSHCQQAGLKLSSHFVDQEFTIVSGLALGCDTIGHKSSTSAGKPTIAVLAGGLHNVYPKENKSLAEDILSNQGLLISELPYGVNPHKNTFVLRDRIQSGLSLGVMVLETGIKGGTLHTVGYANKQNRKVACMYSHINYGSADHPSFQGNKMLVNEGKAIPIANKEDITRFAEQLNDRWNALDKSSIKENLPSPPSKEVGGQLSMFK